MLSMLTVYPNDPTAVPPVLVRPDAGRLFFGRGRPGGLPPFSGLQCEVRLAVPGRRATRAGGCFDEAIRHAVIKE